MTGTVAELPVRAATAGIGAPAIIVVGEVARLATPAVLNDFAVAAYAEVA